MTIMLQSALQVIMYFMKEQNKYNCHFVQVVVMSEKDYDFKFLTKESLDRMATSCVTIRVQICTIICGVTIENLIT